MPRPACFVWTRQLLRTVMPVRPNCGRLRSQSTNTGSCLMKALPEDCSRSSITAKRTDGLWWFPVRVRVLYFLIERTDIADSQAACFSVQALGVHSWAVFERTVVTRRKTKLICRCLNFVQRTFCLLALSHRL